MIFAVLSCDRSGNAIDRTAGHIAPIAKPPRAGANRSFPNGKDLRTLSNLVRLVESAALAFRPSAADIGHGRLAVDEPLANRVRSGRKQP